MTTAPTPWTKGDDGGPAFPQSETKAGNSFDLEFGRGGMSLRDYFAAAAVSGMFASDTATSVMTTKLKAQVAYELADAMLAARTARGETKEPEHG